MAVRTLTYMDLTPEQRRKGAHKMREKLLGVLNHPFITPEQQKSIFDKIALVDRWERMDLPVSAVHPQPALPAVAAAALTERNPRHHEVTLAEDLALGEKLS